MIGTDKAHSVSPGAARNPSDCALARSLVDDLTHVRLLWIEGKSERWIRFGRVAREQIIDRRVREVAFRPGSVFAFVRWASNDFGTVVSRIDIILALAGGTAHATIPGITPGGDILLRIAGWPRVERVLRAIDQVEEIGIDPCDAAPDHWRHLHNRMSAGLPARPYSLNRHRAWLGRRSLQP